MSMAEKLPVENTSAGKTEENPVEVAQWCPKCGAALKEGTKAEVAPDIPTCEACGMPLGPVLVAPGSENVAGFPPQGPGGPRKNRNPLALVVVAVVVAGMLYAGFHFARRADADAPSVLGASTPAPDFTLESLDGKSMKLSDLRGKAVLLNFWATWCGPCKIETPWLVEMQNQYGSQGLQVVGVAMDDSGKDEIAKFAKEMGVNYPVLLGKEAVGDAYGGIPYLPESFFIGRDGKIVSKIMGIDSRSVLENAVKKALDTHTSAANMAAPALQAQK
jgi:thiol-disulfide isomerase/thioredoxin